MRALRTGNTRPLTVCYVETEDAAFLSHRIHLGRAAIAAGMRVHVIAPGGGAAEKLRAEGFSYHRLALDRGGVNPLSEGRAIAELFRLYRRIEPDVAHHIALKAVIYGNFAARAARVPAIVGSITGLGYAFTGTDRRRVALRTIMSRLLKLSLWGSGAHTIFQNPEDRAFFVDRNLVEAERSSVILGSGVDTERFRPRPEPTGDLVVVVGTRMLWDKGIAEVVEAARLLRRAGRKCRVVLAGIPDPANPATVTESQLRAWHAEGIVEWVGQVSDMAELLASCHIACLPSYREGLPLFLVEAAAAGRPSVAADVVGCRAVVQNEESGLLVRARDPVALAAALERLIGDAELRKRMGAQARGRALALFSKEHVTDAIFGVYESLLAPAGSEHH